MSQLQTSLILTGDARGLVVAAQRGDAEIDKLGATVLGLGQKMKSAQASADVFNREIDQQSGAVNQLRANVDPLFAATQRLEAGQETLTRAYRSGIISLNEYDSTLELLQRQHLQVAAAVDLQSAATSRLTTQTRGGAGGMQNFSYQLQDVFTQVGMGVPLMISLGQQAPQILSGFGTVGAIAGVAAAAILPLTAVIFGLGYQSKETAEEVKTAAELIDGALSEISNAQSTLRENSLRDLDGIVDKYGEVTASVLTLMQAENRLALQRAQAATRTGISETFSTGSFQELSRFADDRNAAMAEIREMMVAPLEDIANNIDVEQARRAVETLEEDLTTLREGAKLDELFKIDPSTMQDLLIYQNAIQEALAAENFDGLLTVITQMRETLQDIPDGPLKDMLEALVPAEGALREMLHTAELNAEQQREIEAILERVGSIDISSNLAAAADQASRIANELGRAVSNAIALANQGVGDVERARINFDFRDDPLGRAGALAGAEFDARASLPAGADSTIRNVVEKEKREFVGARVEAARYNQQLQAWRKEQSAANRKGRSGGGGGSSGRGGRGRRNEAERTIKDINRQMDRLSPSYERDIASLEQWRADAMSTLDPAREGYEAFANDVAFIFNERLAEAYRADLDRREDWAAGVERGFLDLQDDMLTFADVSEDLSKKWTTGLEDAFVEMGRTGKFEVGSLVDYTLEQLQRLAFQQSIQPGLEAGVGIFTDFIGGLFGGIGGGTTATQSHAGSTIGAGGVRRSYGPNAPLRADEQLTVTTLGQRVFTPEQISNGATVVDALANAAQSQGSGGVVFAPQIKVENHSSTPVSGQMEEESDNRGGRSYRLVLADEVGAAISRKGGGARRTLKQDFNVKQRGTLR